MVAADGLPMQEASLSIAVVLALYSQYITAPSQKGYDEIIEND